jgi:hypothetical protein
MNPHPTLSQFTRTWQAKDLIDAYWAGQLGDVWFIGIGLSIGLTFPQLSQVMSDVREEDGTL